VILRDPVHGLVSFESEEDAIVPRLLAASEVQRLRRIRQLGLTSLAFPGAEHTRFAHAVGAAHVMQRFLARLRQIDGDLPFWQRPTSERGRDAIAAALLTTSATVRCRTSSRRPCPAR
jgi:HD superfamily phosphohydrolase